MDIVIKKVMKVIMDGLFYKIAHAFSIHAYMHPPKLDHGDGWRKMPQGHNMVGGISKDVQMVSPSLSSAVVVHQGKATNPSFVANMVDLVRYDCFFVRNDVGFAKLQCQDFVMSQQMIKIKVFVSNICIGISICHGNMDTSYNELDQNVYIKVDEWWMTIASIKGHIDDQGNWACDAFNVLSTEDQDATIHNIVIFSITMVNELRHVQAKWDSNNEATMTELPPVMHAQLVHLHPRDFMCNILGPRCTHLSRFWSPGEIEDVE
jgi:hypothetical protein